MSGIGPVLTIALVGFVKLTVGGIGVTVKLSPFDTSDKGDGSMTVTESVPVAPRLAAGTVATS